MISSISAFLPLRLVGNPQPPSQCRHPARHCPRSPSHLPTEAPQAASAPHHVPYAIVTPSSIANFSSTRCRAVPTNQIAIRPRFIRFENAAIANSRHASAWLKYLWHGNRHAFDGSCAIDGAQSVGGTFQNDSNRPRVVPISFLHS
jgi:hypothetical protein